MVFKNLQNKNSGIKGLGRKIQVLEAELQAQAKQKGFHPLPAHLQEPQPVALPDLAHAVSLTETMPPPIKTNFPSFFEKQGSLEDIQPDEPENQERQATFIKLNLQDMSIRSNFGNQSPFKVQAEDNSVDTEHHAQIKILENSADTSVELNTDRTLDDPSMPHYGWQMWTYEQCTVNLKRYPKMPQALLRLANLLCNVYNRPEEAQLKLNDLIKADNTFQVAKVQEAQGDVFLKLNKQKNVQRALRHYNKSYNIEPDNLQLLLKMGKCYDKCGEFTNSVTQYLRALAKQPEDTSIMFKLGWANLQAGNKEQGLVQMRRSVGGGETNINNLIKLSEVLLRQDDVKHQREAVTILNKALVLNPMSVDAMVVLGRAYEKLNEPQNARMTYERAVATPNCQSTGAFFYLGVACEKNREYQPAISALKQCLTLDQEHFGAAIHLATLLANTGDAKKAAKYYRHALKIQPDSIPANFGLGKTLHIVTNNAEAAIPYFQKVISQDPKHYKAFCQLGVAQMELGKYDDAAESINKCLDLNPKHVPGLVAMGNLLFATGHSGKSQECHLKALEFNPKELTALIGLGNAYYDLNKIDDAISCYLQAIGIDDQIADVHFNLANAYSLQGKPQAAIPHYQTAINLKPSKSDFYYNLGNAYCVQKNYTDAITAFKKAIQYDSYNAAALYNLGNAYYMCGQIDKSISAYMLALKLNPNSAECHFNIATAYNDAMTYKLAQQHFETSLELNPKNADTLYELGRLYQLRQFQTNFELSEQYYLKALAIQPDHRKAAIALEQVQTVLLQ